MKVVIIEQGYTFHKGLDIRRTDFYIVREPGGRLAVHHPPISTAFEIIEGPMSYGRMVERLAALRKHDKSERGDAAERTRG